MVAAILYSREDRGFSTNIDIGKNLISPFWAKVTPLPIRHFITLHNNNGLNSENFEDTEITNK